MYTLPHHPDRLIKLRGIFSPLLFTHIAKISLEYLRAAEEETRKYPRDDSVGVDRNVRGRISRVAVT